MYGTLSYIHKDLFVPICTRLFNNNGRAMGGGVSSLRQWKKIECRECLDVFEALPNPHLNVTVVIMLYFAAVVGGTLIAYMTYSYSTCHIVILHDILLLYMTYSYCG